MPNQSQPKSESSPLPVQGDHDRVAMASRHPDGSPNQTKDFTFVDEQFAVEASKAQLAEQAVSAVDAEKRGVTVDDGEGSTDPDPVVAELVKAHQDAEAQAHKAAEAEVKSRVEKS